MDNYFENGYASLNNGIATYHTYVYDHHGNICNVVNQNGTLEQRYNYYPYGGLTNELSYDVDTQNRKSKE